MLLNYRNLVIQFKHMRNLLLMDEQRKWFLRKESNPGEDTVKIVEIRVKDLEHYIHLVAKAVAWFQRLTPILKEILLWVKCYQTVLHATEKFFHERKSQLMK